MGFCRAISIKLSDKGKRDGLPAPFTLVRSLRSIRPNSNTGGGGDILLAEAEPNPNNGPPGSKQPAAWQFCFLGLLFSYV